MRCMWKSPRIYLGLNKYILVPIDIYANIFHIYMDIWNIFTYIEYITIREAKKLYPCLRKLFEWRSIELFMVKVYMEEEWKT